MTYNRTHDNYIAFMGLETLNSLGLTSGRFVTHYHALTLIGQLFAGTPSVLESHVQGLKGVFVACCEEKCHYMLLLINENDGEVKIPKVNIDGSAVTPIFHQESLYGKSLESRDVIQEKIDAKTLALRPYSVNVIKFVHSHEAAVH